MTPSPSLISDSSARSGRLEPPPSSKRMAKQLAKTRFCKHQLRGYCRYEDQCAYAHSTDELLPRPNFLKTKVCVNFLAGTCNNRQCTYAHGLTELVPGERLRGPSSKQSVMSDSVTVCSQNSNSTQAVTEPGGLMPHVLHGLPLTAPPSRNHQSAYQQQSPQQTWTPQPQRQQRGDNFTWPVEAGSNIPASVQQAAQQAAREAAQQVLMEGAALFKREQAQQAQPAMQPATAPAAPQQSSAAMVQQLWSQLQQQEQQQRQLQIQQQEESKVGYEWKLMIGVLTTVVQSMIQQDDIVEPEIVPKAPKAALNFGRLAQRLLASKRKAQLMEGNCLLQCERRGMWQQDEQLVICILLRDATWVPLFPELVRCCSAMTALRLRAQPSALDPGTQVTAPSLGAWVANGRLGSLAEEEEADDAGRKGAGRAGTEEQSPQNFRLEHVPPPPGLEPEMLVS